METPGETHESEAVQAAAAPATSDLEAQVIEFTGCSLTVARAAIEAAGPAGLERAVDLALSGECTPQSAGTQQSAGPHKAVCLVRRDLNMGPGKVAAQVAHAVLGVYRLAQDRSPAVLQAQRRPAHPQPPLRPHSDPCPRAHPHSPSCSPSLALALTFHPHSQSWVGGGEAIIVLGVDSAEQMKSLLSEAAQKGLCTHCVADAGRTEVAPGTETVGCIGPATVQSIDVVTGHLGLL